MRKERPIEPQLAPTAGFPAGSEGKESAWVQSLGWADPLEEGMATRSSILAWGIPTDRGAWRATVPRVTSVGHN